MQAPQLDADRDQPKSALQQPPVPLVAVGEVGTEIVQQIEYRGREPIHRASAAEQGAQGRADAGEQLPPGEAFGIGKKQREAEHRDEQAEAGGEAGLEKAVASNVI